MSIRRQYESTYIMNAALEDGEVETLIQRVSDFITENGGAIQELNKWGRRRLAYPIKKKYNGYYVYMVFESAAEIVPQLERFFTTASCAN
jgi:small subunit ribosomal protein S6